MGVYLDVVFALNGAVNYFLLCAAGRLCGAMPPRRRLIGAAAFGALYACAVFLPGLRFLSGTLWRIAALAVMLALACGLRRRTVRLGAVFLALSLALCGLLLVLSGALGAKVRLLEGVAYYALGFPTLVLTAGAVYLGAWLLLQGVMAHPGGIVQARLTLLGKSADLHLLRDTGNTLCDPFTGRHVPVVEARVFAELLPELPGQDAVQAVQALHARFPALTVRLLPYRAVGTEGAMLPAIRCDSLRIGNREKRNILAAISPTKVSENGEYEGLIGEGD